VVEDNDGVSEADILITNEEIGRENIFHFKDGDEEENQADIDMID
jgi:hypothetical protein